MGSFQNYQRAPKALLVVDNSLKETARGVYTTTVKLPGPGRYDVALLVDSPRVASCFDVAVAENADLPRETATAIKIEPLITSPIIHASEGYNLRFRVLDANSKQPKANLADLGVMVFLAPGIWQQRQVAKAQGDGIYEMSFVPPQAGVYYVYFQCPSLGMHFSQIAPLTLQATKP